MSIGNRINKEYDRVDKNIVKGFEDVPVANIGDAMNRFNIMDKGINTINKLDVHMVGSAITVKVRDGDNLMIHKAANMAKPGDVLVIDAESGQRGLWGELLTLWAINKKIAGVVIDGAVRDRQFIFENGFPVFSRYISPAGGDKNGPGEINFPVSCGGVSVTPGDIVVGDADGVVVIPKSNAELILKKVQKVIKKEEDIAEEVKSGKWERPWLNKISND